MKRICIVTATRAEYGLLRWTIEALRAEPGLDAQLIVTGTHLSPAFGDTWRQIEADGLRIDRKIDYLSEDRTPAGIARETGLCASKFSEAFTEMKPDLLLVLGDRYELLPICGTALLLGIPIAHIAGGEHTEGAIDERVRNAVTMMADLHFPNSAEAAAEIVRMRGSDHHVYDVGEPSVENSIRIPKLSRTELADVLGLDPGKDWVLATLHPETLKSREENLAAARNLLEVLLERPGCEIVMSGANADPVGEEMNAIYRGCRSPRFHFHDSLGQRIYLGVLNEALYVIGNSSSGVIETPLSGIPAINIGDRQKGRRLCANVICCESVPESIRAAIGRVGPRLDPDLSFGDGHTSDHIVRHIKDYFDER